MSKIKITAPTGHSPANFVKGFDFDTNLAKRIYVYRGEVVIIREDDSEIRLEIQTGRLSFAEVPK